MDSPYGLGVAEELEATLGVTRLYGKLETTLNERGNQAQRCYCRNLDG
jgi:hypothetical protein